MTSMRAYIHDINTHSEDRVATLMRSSSQTLFDEIINRLKSLTLHTSNHKENLEEAKGLSKGRINIVITADVIKVFTKISMAVIPFVTLLLKSCKINIPAHTHLCSITMTLHTRVTRLTPMHILYIPVT